MRYTTKGFVLVAAAIGAAIFAMTALAGSGGRTGNSITYVAASGEINDILVTKAGTNHIQIQDRGTIGGLPIVVAATGSCTQASITNLNDTLDCTGIPKNATLSIQAKDGNDKVRIDSSVDADTNLDEIDVDGGSGNDTQLQNDSGAFGGGTVPTTFTGGPGDDVIIGRAGGSDTVTYASAPSRVIVSLRTPCPAGPGGTGCATGDGTDTLAQIKNVTGSPANDTIEGNTFPNNLDGGGGNDTVSYVGAPGNVDVDLSAQSATGADGNDAVTNFTNVIGSDNDDTITGDDAHDNVLNGGSGADIINGKNGDDTLIGGAGNDTLNGGAGGSGGTDTVDYSGSDDPFFHFFGVSVNLPGGTAAGLVTTIFGPPLGNNSGNDTLANVENVVGSSLADSFTGTGGANEITGGAGDDTISGNGGADILNGGDGNDPIDESGNANNAVVKRGAGNDTPTRGSSGHHAPNSGDRGPTPS